MVHNFWSTVSVNLKSTLPQLRGEIGRFLDPDGRNWPLEEPPNQRPGDQRPSELQDAIYPRSDAITWMALAIIEKAYSQINSEHFVKGADFVPRRLRNILVTFPPGWTSEEYGNYRAKWQKALNIFALAHLGDLRSVRDGGQKPELLAQLDEAVAAQLPLLYSEVLRLPTGWFELMGRAAPAGFSHPLSRNQQIEPKVLRILNLDIGGGTTDVAIVEYANTAGGAFVNLTARPILKYSSNIAGDLLVKKVIEEILLPMLAGNDKQTEEHLRSFFGDPPARLQSLFGNFRAEQARIVRLVLIPVVHGWLGGLRHEDPLDAKDEAEAPYNDSAWLKLQQLYRKAFGEAFPEIEWKWSAFYNLGYVKKLEECVKSTFSKLLRPVAEQVAAFDADLVFVSGKPSEANVLRDLLREGLPLPPHSIIFAKDFTCGPWYPLRNVNHCIEDAKSVTAVGAALYQAIQSGWINNWNIEVQEGLSEFNRNEWGIMPTSRQTAVIFDNNILLASDQDEGKAHLMVNAMIGRRRPYCPGVMPDPVYQLCWVNQPAQGAQRFVEVTLRREKDEAGNERIILVEAQAADSGQPITLNDLRLRLKTIPAEGFWMDEPRFDFVSSE